MSGGRAGTLFRQSAAILVLAAGLALLYNAFSPRRIPILRKEIVRTAAQDSLLFGAKDSAKGIIVHAPLHEQALRERDSALRVSGVPREAERAAEVKIINLQQFRRLIDEKRPLILDARSTEDYERGHLKRARSVPALEADSHFPELAQIPKDTLVVIYCSNPECELGRMLIEYMKVMEFSNMYLYDQGWDEWVRAGMPSEKGKP